MCTHSFIFNDGREFPTTLFATTWMVCAVPLCSPLSTVLVAVAGSSSGVEPLLGTAVTVYPVTGGLLSCSVGGVHVTVMDEPEVAMTDTSITRWWGSWAEQRTWKSSRYNSLNSHSLQRGVQSGCLQTCYAPIKSNDHQTTQAS